MKTTTLAKRLLLLAMAMVMLLSCAACGSKAEVTINEKGESVFYVSPTAEKNGNGTLEAPFNTIEAARDAVRTINKDMTANITVYLMGGDYRVTEPIEFDVRDSATNGFTISYEAYEDEVPVINGSVAVTGWEKHDDKLYKAPLDRDYKLRNLYVNDHRANMGSVTVEAQGSVGEYTIKAGQADWAWVDGTMADGVSYNLSDIPEVTSNLDDLEIVNGTTWNENIVCTRDVKIMGNTVVMMFQQPYGSIAQVPGWGAGFVTTGTHTVYNAFSFVDEPGEFYFDKTEKVLYYYPLEGEDMSTAKVEAPVAESLIVVKGENTENRVEGLSFKGITFAHTDYMLTEVGGSYGKSTCQAAQSFIAFCDTYWHGMKYEMVDTLPGAVMFESCSDIIIENCIVKHTGADGINMVNDVVDSKIVGNFITDITSSGITLGHPQHVYIGDKAEDNKEKYDVGVEGVCKNNIIMENMLYDISVVHGFGGCAAITAYFVDSAQIIHNTVQKTAYNGIHLGWGWCNFTDSTTCRDNVISYNRVIDSLDRLNDSGAIYTIGQMEGTEINYNYVDGIPGVKNGRPTYGLHNDEGTAWIVEKGNVLDISPNVTYTINCEEWGDKHDLIIKDTYATVNKMGKNPPNSEIDPINVVADAVWPLEQYKTCLNSGLSEEYDYLIPDWLTPEADIVFPASCATDAGNKIPIRTSDNIVWIAPDNTTVFVEGDEMTKANPGADEIYTPIYDGEYRIYVVDADGNVLSKSEHILRLGSYDGPIEAEAYDTQEGTSNEDCSEGGTNVAYIENGDYIGFTNVNFGKGSTAIDLRLASQGAKTTVEIRLGAPDGELLGSVEVSKSTGGWQTWQTFTAEIPETKGRQDIYFVFVSENTGYIINMNWWQIVK